MSEHRSETYSGPVWLPGSAADESRQITEEGEWGQVIERRRLVGRLGWQRITEHWSQTGEQK